MFSKLGLLVRKLPYFSARRSVQRPAGIGKKLAQLIVNIFRAARRLGRMFLGSGPECALSRIATILIIRKRRLCLLQTFGRHGQALGLVQRARQIQRLKQPIQIMRVFDCRFAVRA